MLKGIICFLLLAFSFSISDKQDGFPTHFCASDLLKVQPIKVKIPEIKGRRLLADGGYVPLNIKIDYDYLYKIVKDKPQKDIEDKILDALKNSTQTMSKILRVPKLNQEFTLEVPHSKVYGNYFTREYITAKINNEQNFFLYPVFKDLSDIKAFAAASAVVVDGTSGRPIAGVIEINSKLNFKSANMDMHLRKSFLHEITHALGFDITYLKQAKNCIRGKCIIEKQISGKKKQLFAGIKTVEMAKKYFGCEKMDGVELEDEGTEGTAGSHWEMRVMAGDYMVAMSYLEDVISEITLAALEDLGYYKANYYTGGLMRFGKGKGCDFLNLDCTKKSNIINENSPFKNEFYQERYVANRICTASRTAAAKSPQINERKILNKGTIFEGAVSKRIDYTKLADGCPLPLSLETNNEDYNVYNCHYGNVNLMENENSNYKYDYKGRGNFYPKTLPNVLSDHSFCALSTVIEGKKGTIEQFKKTDGTDKNGAYYFNYRPVCMEMFCSSESLTIKTKDYYLVCPKLGGKITYDENHDGHIACPDFNLICTGTEMCNDLFDCIDKESEYNEESFKYGKTKTITSQDLDDLQDQAATEGYELSDDGKCPINCQKCNLSGKCLTCRTGYKIAGKGCIKDSNHKDPEPSEKKSDEPDFSKMSAREKLRYERIKKYQEALKNQNK